MGNVNYTVSLNWFEKKAHILTGLHLKRFVVIKCENEIMKGQRGEEEILDKLIEIRENGLYV